MSVEAQLPASTLVERIAAAFVDGVKSGEVVGLIREAEAAAISSADAADRARERAFDPALTATSVAAARREMEDAAFRRDRMQEAGRRLGGRLREVRRQEEQGTRSVAKSRESYNARLLSFTAAASTYTSLPICRNFSDICAMPCSLSFSVAA
jgi:hypothetical protein